MICVIVDMTTFDIRCFLLHNAFAAIILFTETLAATPCDSRWILGPGGCYWFNTNALTFTNGQAACRRQGGYLASILSSTEQTFISGNLHNLGNVLLYIGLTDSSSEGTWRWTDGSVLSYTNWRSKEPNDSNNDEDCVSVENGGQWNDISCNQQRGFICKNKRVDGSWGSWQTWSNCDVTCGPGTQTRTRKCNSPLPVSGGHNCSGQGTELKSCTVNKCPIDGNWGSWQTWSDCDITCGSGNQTRIRKCDSPVPVNGGRKCPGQNTELKSCTVNKCIHVSGSDAEFCNQPTDRLTPLKTGSCYFDDGNCSYSLPSSDGYWSIQYGPRKTGWLRVPDNLDGYALAGVTFTGSGRSTLTSKLIPVFTETAFCLRFMYFALFPLSKLTLSKITKTATGDTLWNQGSKAHTKWENVTVSFSSIENFQLQFEVEKHYNAVVGIDEINLFSYQHAIQVTSITRLSKTVDSSKSPDFTSVDTNSRAVYQTKATISKENQSFESTVSGKYKPATRTTSSENPADRTFSTEELIFTEKSEMATYAMSQKKHTTKGPKMSTTTVTKTTETLGVKTCPSTTDTRGTKWRKKRGGSTAYRLCNTGFKGLISRYCSDLGIWAVPIYDCVSTEIANIVNKFNKTLLSQEANSSVVTETLGSIAKSTVSKNLQEGDLQAVTSVLESIADASQFHEITDNQTEKYLEVASNIIDAGNQRSWNALKERNSNLAATVLKSVDNFLGVLSEQLNNTNAGNVTKVFLKLNLVAEVGLVSSGYVKIPNRNGVSKALPKWLEDSSTGVVLKGMSSSGSSHDSYSGAIFKDISAILSVSSNTKKGKAAQNQTVNSNVIAFRITPKPKTLDPPLLLLFDHFTQNLTEPICSFWNFNASSNGSGGWSGDGCWVVNSSQSQTVCACNHVTNFAILMSPSRTPDAHIRTLSIISGVGCGVSICFLVITIALYAKLWRKIGYMKGTTTLGKKKFSESAVILMNLCSVLVVANITFLAGVDRTENKKACTAIALLLLYLYLVVFFLMLAEGVTIAVKILRQFFRKSTLKWTLLISWGIPVAIVAASVGVTKLDGFGSELNCWLSLEHSLIWTFAGPALFVIVLNVVLVAVSLASLRHNLSIEMTSVKIERKNKTDYRQLRTALKRFCLLVPIIGTTWIFGVFSINDDLIVFQYIFVICNSLQGLFIFISYGVFHDQVRMTIHKLFIRRRKWSLHSQSATKTTSDTLSTSDGVKGSFDIRESLSSNSMTVVRKERPTLAPQSTNL